MISPAATSISSYCTGAGEVVQLKQLGKNVSSESVSRNNGKKVAKHGGKTKRKLHERILRKTLCERGSAE